MKNILFICLLMGLTLSLKAQSGYDTVVLNDTVTIMRSLPTFKAIPEVKELETYLDKIKELVQNYSNEKALEVLPYIKKITPLLKEIKTQRPDLPTNPYVSELKYYKSMIEKQTKKSETNYTTTTTTIKYTASGRQITIVNPTPEMSNAYLQKSIEFYKNKNVKEALNYADSAIAANSDNAEAYFRSGCYRIDLKDTENAKEDLKTAQDKGHPSAQKLYDKLNQPVRLAPGQGVYICNTGQKYHSSDGCRGLSRCTHGTSYVSKSDAQSQGYSGCGYCYR